MVINTGQRPTDLSDAMSRSSHQAPERALTSEPQFDRVIRALLVAIPIVLVGLVAQLWVTYSRSPSATHDSIRVSSDRSHAEDKAPLALETLATFQATATPTATPQPSAQDRAAQHILLLQRSWDARDWQQAIGRLNQVAELDDNYPGLQRARCDTYLHWADELEKGCQIRQAIDLYRQATLYCQNRDFVLERKKLALRYLSGKWRYDHDQWSQAASVLHTVYEDDPNYAVGCREPVTTTQEVQTARALDVRSLLYASYLASSRDLLEQTRMQEAHEAAQAALTLAPDSRRAADLLSEISDRLTPTPSPPTGSGNTQGKRIEVSLSRQRMYVWQGDQLLYEWVCSTGGPGSGTATGRYRVQSKIPEAWASRWSLRMPYWLGIYNVGTMENGIHALPILSNGRTLWAGYLGTPVSYGCIILSTENARALYQWADIGTPVWIDS